MTSLGLTRQLRRMLVALYNCPGMVGASVFMRILRTDKMAPVRHRMSMLRAALPDGVRVGSFREGDCYFLEGRNRLRMIEGRFFFLEDSCVAAEAEETA